MAIGGLLIASLGKDQPVLSVLNHRYMRLGIVIALVAVGVNFLVQVGYLADSGWAGLFNLTYAEIIWDSPVGDSTLIRLLALAAMLLVMIFVPGLHVLLAACALALAGSFALVGHTTDLSLITRGLLGLHVLIALLWVGSLLPLWQACQLLEISRLKQLMQQFSLIAMGFVAALLLCGVLVAWQLLGSLSELFTSNYGRLLLIKIILVCTMLGFAAWNKWRLVPKLNGTPSVRRLERSILLECLVGITVLVLTVLMTSLTGPESVHGHH